MFSPKTNKLNPSSFDFPFTPYEIQLEFMKNLYMTIENKKIGIFESPTGTGKSLSLMCGALKWLNDHNALIRLELAQQMETLKIDIMHKEANSLTGSDWLTDQSETIQLKEKLHSLKMIYDLVAKHDTENEELKKRVQKVVAKKHWKNKMPNKIVDEVDLIGVPEIYQDEDEFLVNDDQILDSDDDDDESKTNKFQGTQIFFCSRTHSQLSQVVNEVKQTIYGKSIQIASLASRQNYCINPAVKKLQSNVLINEQCLELQKGTCKKATITSAENGRTIKKAKNLQQKKCPFYAQQQIENLRDTVLVDLMDIEELVKVAAAEKACPYYAARLAAQSAQLVMLPYQMLLHKRTRLQTGLSLKNNIVIIDEGHNLIDTISNIYSAEITLAQLQRAHHQLIAYKNKYFSRFSTKNLLKINQLIFVTNRLVKILEIKKIETSNRMILPYELMVEGEFFNIKINEILDFCENTRLAQKVHGYAQKYGSLDVAATVTTLPPNRFDYLKKLSEKVNNKKVPPIAVLETVSPQNGSVDEQQKTSSGSVIRPLLAFLDCLMEKTEDGRILISHCDGLKSKSFLKFLLLNPSSHFKDILEECRSVIVAGGTMQPTTDFKNQLFGSQQERVDEYFFGHVVPKESIIPLVVSKGPTNIKFNFNFQNRNNPELLTELSRAIQNVCNVVPAGIVCFFGSYDYMDTFYKYLEKSGDLTAIRSKKVVFCEPRNSNEVEKMLLEYSKAAKRKGTPNGAFLLSVVGGKLSEGLNFSDDLGRCVIVVGLPFPNKNNPELAEKIKYLDSTYHRSAGAEYYTNICMKAVNQCIGRAVRHINDYASVLLFDERYASENISSKLPTWIGRSLKYSTSFGMVQGSLAKFFRDKRL